MSVLAPFEISISHAGVNLPAIVTPKDGCEIVEFEILMNGRKLRIIWDNDINNEVPTLLPKYFSPDVKSFHGNNELYELILAEMMEVLCERFS